MEQIAFQIGGLAIHWYGVLVATGFLAGLWTASRRCEREGIPGETVVDLGPWLVLAAIAGSRLLHVVSYWREEFADKPWWEIFMIHHGGLVFYGGLIGASLTTIFYVRAKQLPLWKMGDVLAPSISLGHVFGRLGCLMNGCCYGLPTNLPWTLHYPIDHPTRGMGVHPTQVYEAVANLGLYGLLAWQYRHKRFDGQVFALYLIGYAILRSIVELFRGDYAERYLGGLATPAHLISAGLLVTGLWLWLRLSRPSAGTADATV